MTEPGRQFSIANYRYGFNGKENDKDISEGGQDYGMRIYDARLGRFLSVDPIADEFPWNSPYSFAEGDPINYNDLDGLERGPNTAQSGGRGTGSRTGRSGRITYVQSLAQSVGNALRRGQEVRERAARIRHIREMNTNPQYRSNYMNTQNFVNTLVRNQQVSSYWQNAFNSASVVLTGGGVQDNKKSGDAWDNLVHEAMVKNPTYIGVARQISLKVTGMVNGKVTVANIKMDNVGIKIDPLTQKTVFDLKEAKYSINEITINNVIQHLTPQQKNAANILINGNDVQFFIRGNGSTEAMNNAIYGTGQTLINGQNITGQIGEINVLVPGQPKNNSSGVTVNPTTVTQTKAPN